MVLFPCEPSQDPLEVTQPDAETWLDTAYHDWVAMDTQW